MLDEILKKFVIEDNFIFEYSGWTVLYRETQVTLGSLVLIYSEKDATSLGEISPSAFSHLPYLINTLEKFFIMNFEAEKFNYLALMMIDPQPHFHFFPRYSKKRLYKDKTYQDSSWPGPISLSVSCSVDHESKKALISSLKKFIGSHIKD